MRMTWSAMEEYSLNRLTQQRHQELLREARDARLVRQTGRPDRYTSRLVARLGAALRTLVVPRPAPHLKRRHASKY